MCTRKISPLCRLAPPPSVIAGTVGDAPLVYIPVELVPSPALLYRSNFTATLLGIPGAPVVALGPYPSPPPAGPIAVTAEAWIVKVIPSALGVFNWKVKLFVKLCTFTGVFQYALAASNVAAVSVSCSRVPLILVCPLNCIPVCVKPEPKLIAVVPLWMAIVEVDVALVEKFGAVAMALTVVVVFTVNVPVYAVEDVVGWLPSTV